jgi:NTP pyrophosphatase (non-canonical NTP hydrolase)
MAKLRVRSVEEIIFRKYPYVYPYCRKAPHEDGICKTVKGTKSTVNHLSLREFYESNQAKKPVTLDEWQTMFKVIYPRSTEDRGRSTLGLFEELGEMAEAVRVFERYPKYFAGEAADVFSYLMGIANEYSLREAQNSDHTISLQGEYLKRFPGLCIGCGHRICVCPSIPLSTVGRMSKELSIEASERLFDHSDENMMSQGSEAASTVLQSVGGYQQLAERFPADRGDANSALMVLCLKLAEAVDKTNSVVAERFRSAAIELGSAPAPAGSKQGQSFLSTHGDLLVMFREVLRTLQASPGAPDVGLKHNPLALDLSVSLSKLRVLFVYPSPADQDALRSAAELRAIQQAVQLSGRSDVEIEGLPAATIDDLRRKLMSEQYEIIHFAGHATSGSILFESESGDSVRVQLSNLAGLLKQSPGIQYVILNACDSLSGFDVPMAAYTIGMTQSVTDESAIEFARGFYDAICRGKPVEYALESGRTAAALKNLQPPKTKLIFADKSGKL